LESIFIVYYFPYKLNRITFVIMKINICFMLVLILCISCGSNNKIKLSNKLLSGNWIVINAEEADETGANSGSVSREIFNAKNDILYIYKFNDSGKVFLDTGSATIIPGTYKIEDTILILNFASQLPKKIFKITELQDSSFYGITAYPAKENIDLYYEFKKAVEPPSASITNVMWKKPLPINATDNEINERMKTMMLYYGYYFSILNASGANIFNETKVCLPIKLYSGGLGMKEIAEVPEFEKILGSKANAIKGAKIMSETFNNDFAYPKRDNYMLEYAEILKTLSSNIK
jgi:hypothetical protein